MSIHDIPAEDVDLVAGAIYEALNLNRRFESAGDESRERFREAAIAAVGIMRLRRLIVEAGGRVGPAE